MGSRKEIHIKMGKIAYIHFMSKVPRNAETKAVSAVVVCADYEGYKVITKRVRTGENETNNPKWTNLIALKETFAFIYDMQASMLKSGVTKVYLVTDSTIMYSFLTKRPTNSFVRRYINSLYQLYGFGGSKELRIGVGVAKLCSRNSARSRCDSSLIEKETNTEIEDTLKVYCFPEDIKGISIKSLLEEPEIDGLDGLKLQET